MEQWHDSYYTDKDGYKHLITDEPPTDFTVVLLAEQVDHG
jgi:hypothetical protein